MSTLSIIVGAGPAGLTAAHELFKHDRQPLVLEKTDQVGGIARTETYEGYRFDIGGHRFFTKVGEVEALMDALPLDAGSSDETSLINRFYYPRKGPGQMWECARRRVNEQGGRVRMNTEAVRLHHDVWNVNVERSYHEDFKMGEQDAKQQDLQDARAPAAA